MSSLLKRYKIEIAIFLFSSAYFLLFARYGADMHDEGFHLYISNMIFNGLLPYRDFPIHATPGSFHLQGLIFRIFSPTIYVGRLSVVFLGVYIANMLFKISRTLVKSDCFAAISSIVFIFWGVSHVRHPWYGWYGLAFAITFFYFGVKYLSLRKNFYLFFTGIFCGLTFFMKQNLGMACFVSFTSFLFIDSFLCKGTIKERLVGFLKDAVIFLIAMGIALGPIFLYYFFKGALSDFLYYVFKFSIVSAKGRRFIFNPYPHIKSPSLLILCVFLIFAWFSYNSIWAKRRKIFLCLKLALALLFIFGAIFFVIKINDIDDIYMMDKLKMGAVNGFFNIGMLSVLFGAFVVLRKVLRKKYDSIKDAPLLFSALFCLLYTWAALCISRDFLHLVLGMPVTYALIAFMFHRTNQKLRGALTAKGKDRARVTRFSNQVLCIAPLMFISYFGFFTTLKNEGFRSVYPPLLDMRSKLGAERARGVVVTEDNKNMIDNMVNYIRENTKEGEKVLGIYKSLLLNFLSDRMQPSSYYYLQPDLFRADKQHVVISDMDKYNVKLVIAEKDMWDNFAYYMDEKNNPLTFKIWRYVARNYKADRDFGEYYILKKIR